MSSVAKLLQCRLSHNEFAGVITRQLSSYRNAGCLIIVLQLSHNDEFASYVRLNRNGVSGLTNELTQVPHDRLIKKRARFCVLLRDARS